MRVRGSILCDRHHTHKHDALEHTHHMGDIADVRYQRSAPSKYTRHSERNRSRQDPNECSKNPNSHHFRSFDVLPRPRLIESSETIISGGSSEGNTDRQ